MYKFTMVEHTQAAGYRASLTPVSLGELTAGPSGDR